MSTTLRDGDAADALTFVREVLGIERSINLNGEGIRFSVHAGHVDGPTGTLTVTIDVDLDHEETLAGWNLFTRLEQKQ
jgi:hypothetical protein